MVTSFTYCCVPQKPGGVIDEITDDVQRHEVALQERERLATIVSDIDPHWVFHLATYGAYSSQRDVQTIVSTNYNGTVNLVEACLETGFEAFVNAGSSSEYGYKDHAPVETSWPSRTATTPPQRPAATLYCRFIAQSQQRRLSTLRLYSVYGPWEDPTRLLPKLMVCGLNGELPAPGLADDRTRLRVHRRRDRGVHPDREDRHRRSGPGVQRRQRRSDDTEPARRDRAGAVPDLRRAAMGIDAGPPLGYRRVGRGPHRHPSGVSAGSRPSSSTTD